MKDQLLKNALQLFYLEGYEKTGIRKIVDSCNVGKPTLYHYFGSKKGLLETLIKQSFSPFLENLTYLSEYKGDIVKSLEITARAYFDFAQENSIFYQFYLGILHSPRDTDTHDAVIPYINRQWRIIEEIFAQAVWQHGNMAGRSRRYTLTFLGMINSYITAYFMKEMRLDGDEAYEACRQFMHGIFS